MAAEYYPNEVTVWSFNMAAGYYSYEGSVWSSNMAAEYYSYEVSVWRNLCLAVGAPSSPEMERGNAGASLISGCRGGKQGACQAGPGEAGWSWGVDSYS